MDLPEHRLKGYRNVNHWGYAALEPDVRASLESYFAPHNARLEALLGRRFWRDQPHREYASSTATSIANTMSPPEAVSA